MKRSKAFRLTLFIMSALCVLSLLSCEDNNDTDETGEDDFIIGSYEACIYDDTVYYYDRANFILKCQKLDDLVDGGIPVYSDILAESEENPFNNFSMHRILVDKKATKKNNDYPVLIMAHSEYSGMSKSINIISYNTKTEKITVIKDKIFENVQSMDLYGDYIYYTTNEGELGYNVHRINKDGSGYIKMDNPDKETFRIQDIYKDFVYLKTETGQLYKTTLSLEDKEPLFEVFGKVVAFIIDDYIIYDANPHVAGDDDNTMYAVDICRSPLSDLTVTETLIEDVYIGMRAGNKFYYYLAKLRAVGSGKHDPGTDVLYEYSFDTLSSRVVYDHSGVDTIRYYITMNDKYIAYSENDYSDENGTRYFAVQNLKTNEETKALY